MKTTSRFQAAGGWTCMERGRLGGCLFPPWCCSWHWSCRYGAAWPRKTPACCGNWRYCGRRARYHDVANATADGYVRLSHCVEVPGEGGGGIHYARLDRLFDLVVDPSKPEMLLYAPHPPG